MDKYLRSHAVSMVTVPYGKTGARIHKSTQVRILLKKVLESANMILCEIIIC